MNNDFVKRKREALSKNTLELEKAQAAIKAIVKNGIFRFQSWETVNQAVGRIVDKYTKGIEEGEFKRRAKQSLYNFATVQWRKLRQDFVGVNLSLFSAVLSFVSPKSSDKTRKQAAKKIIQETPQLQITEPVGGRYWDTAQPLQEFSKDYMKRIKKGFYELANSEAKDSYSDRVSLRNIAEMNERFKRQEEELGKLIASGEDIVWISTHGNCSERCEPWQGKLYSISGRSGKIDGIQFQPLSNATDIYYTTKAGKTYKNGCISGFNCRHTLIPYRKGNKPIEIPAEEIERDRTINNTQRRFEQDIRRASAISIGLKDIDPAESVKYSKRSKELYKQYIEYSKQNRVAYYPSRCEVFDGEELINAQTRRVIKERETTLNDLRTKIRQKIDSGEFPLNVKVGAQNKHISGTSEYIPGKSVVILSIEEIQTAVDKCAGNGIPCITKKQGLTEYVIYDRPIGQAINRDGIIQDTNVFKIHYSQKGVHIVPKIW